MRHPTNPAPTAATGTVSVTVTAPVAPPTSVWTATNSTVIVGVLDLAFDPDGDTLTTTAVTQGTNGTVVINVDGTVTYTPTTSFTGDDSFTYTVEDPDGNEATHTITVTVGPTDPVALDNAVQTDTDTPVIVSLTDLAFQPAGGSVTFTVSSGSYGTVVDNLDGTVTYTPDTSYTGTDTFSYVVTDPSLNTASGTITVTVGPAADDDIVNDLNDLTETLDGYDTDNPTNLTSALSPILDAIATLHDDVSSFISVNSIGEHGVRHVAISHYVRVLNYASRLQSQYDALDTMLLESRAVVEAITIQLKVAIAMNNQAQILTLRDQYQDALLAHKDAIAAARQAAIVLWNAEREARLEYRALQSVYPGSNAVLNLNPPAPATVHNFEDRYTPKLP
jgi:hypothetical protein